MRRELVVSVVSFAVLIAGCSDYHTPAEPDRTLLGKAPPTQCLTQPQLDLSAQIRSDIADLFDSKTARTAGEKINNIERQLCKNQYAPALDMAWGFLAFIDDKFSKVPAGDPADVAGIASNVFALAGDPSAGPPFVIPPGAFLPTGGIVTFDPADASPEDPIVAGTENGEAAVVIDDPNAFPPGTGTVTIALARAPGDVVLAPGAFIPGFQAFEEGYEIVSSAQPSAAGSGVLIALCVVPPAPDNVVIGHLHEEEVTLLVATDPDPETLGYIDCSDVQATNGAESDVTLNVERPWVNFARRVLTPVGRLLGPPRLEATSLAVGIGLGGRTRSLSLNAPVDPTIEVGESVQLTVATTASWSSDDADVATVDGTGLVTGVGEGSATITADFGEQTLTTLVTVEGEGTEPASLTFETVSAGGEHSCGVTTDGAGYCWGGGISGFGQLGNGGTSSSTVPVLVSGGLTFTAVSAGFFHSCGVTIDGAAYCWGYNADGQLGDGGITHSSEPVPVLGGLTFAEVSAGNLNSCGVATDGAAYCWGDGSEGQLGTGGTADSSVPVPVSGGLSFAIVSVGRRHSCGVTTDGEAYCWGDNPDGKLGNGGVVDSNVPVLVSGGLTFAAVTAGWFHSCAITIDGDAYCWGGAVGGILGNGGTETSSVPILVSGGLTFTTVDSGGLHSCGVTTDGAAYCWGGAGDGVLGDGGATSGIVPVLVSGGLTFAAVTAGPSHSCGVTTDGEAYCWGYGGDGQLGDGGTTSSNVPVLVADPT